jgi:hypothetical protein
LPLFSKSKAVTGRGAYVLRNFVITLQDYTLSELSRTHKSYPPPPLKKSTDSTPTPVLIFAQDLMIPNVLTVKILLYENVIVQRTSVRTFEPLVYAIRPYERVEI